MVKFKQKNYSSLGAKLLKGLKKTANRVDTSIINSSLKAQRNLGLMKKIPGHEVFNKVSPKSNYQINRETVDSIKKAKKFLPSKHSNAKTKNKLNKILTTPINELSDDFLNLVAENPLTGISTISPIVGSTAVVSPLENKVIKKFIPGYEKMTKKLGDNYKKSTVSKKIRSLKSPSIVDVFGKNISNPHFYDKV